MVTSLFVRCLRVLVAGTRVSIGDVPFNVIVGTRARQALGSLDRLGCPVPPFIVYIGIGRKHYHPLVSSLSVEKNLNEFSSTLVFN